MSRFPFLFILVAATTTAVASTGLVFLEEEKDTLKLWQPKESEFVENTEWVRKQFPSKIRPSTILVLSDNVLQPEVVKATFSLLQDIRDIKNEKGLPIWEEKCVRSPFQKCMEMSILDAFRSQSQAYDEDEINSLSSLAQVRDAIRAAEAESVNGMAFNAKDYLGGVTYDPAKNIFGAKAMLINLLALAENGEDIQKYGELGSYGESNSILDFEEKLLALVNDRQFPQSMVVYPFTMRSFDDIMEISLETDVKTMAAGYMLIYLYVLLNLGKLDLVEQRVWLAVAGIAAVMMGVITSFGIAAYLGIFYSEMNQLLPFLMLGVGVDDMFVITKAFNNLDKEEKELELGKRFGQTMRGAGVAITITSVTDLLAFAIGATTLLPALSSFCIYAALGIFFIFFYVVTFFLACFSYDQRRVEENRDGCLCCWRRKDWQPSECSQRSFLKIAFEALADILVSLPCKIAILVITFGILAGGIYGVARIDTVFDYNNFITEGSYLRNFLRFKELYFPQEGQSSTIYFVDVDYVGDMEKILNLLNDLEQLSSPKKNNIAGDSIKFWIKDFVRFVNRKRGAYYETPFNGSYTNASFHEDLLQFLSNPVEGGMYMKDFEFEKKINLSGSAVAPKILLSSMSYQHHIFEHSKDGTVAMNEVFEAIEKQEFSGKVFATSQAYSSYITMEIITAELYRNMAMALGVVFVCTLILIADLTTSLIVLITVTLTVVNVAGYAYFWGLSIDTLFTIFMTISIGLCVDYSAHIAHAFTVESGSRNERMKKALVNIGPAVLNGGISTFLSFVLLCASKSVIFLTFFKIFFLVVLFGLFHGLLVLPVVLSLVGSNTDFYLESKPTIRSAWHKTSPFEKSGSTETRSIPPVYSVNFQPFSPSGSWENPGGSHHKKLKIESSKNPKKQNRKTRRFPPPI